jgi:hypothetical protein
MEYHNLKALNSQCENALIDKPFHDLNETWLKEYQSLFAIVTILIKEEDIKVAERKIFDFIFSFYNVYLLSTLN